MAQQNSTLTLSTYQTATSVSPLAGESSPKHDVSLEQSKSAQQGFAISPWSDITAEELKAAGFIQREAQFFPFTLAEVRALIMRQFQIGTLRDCFVCWMCLCLLKPFIHLTVARFNDGRCF